VLSGGQLPHPLPALTRRQLRPGHLADDPVTEQPCLPGLLSPAAGFLIGLGHVSSFACG
jgi:hypothetical protein